MKYRGIFLNNEAPSLSTWVQRFGGFNHQFYEKVFELILRLRGNFLWPAMWSPKSFFRDDPLSPQLAHEYGIVIGTSHHEPMMRAWGEWGRFGQGEWNFSTNRENLLNFWEEGVKWAKDYEKVITLGMRGDGDEPMMHDGTLEEMAATMEQIIGDQRRILAKSSTLISTAFRRYGHCTKKYSICMRQALRFLMMSRYFWLTIISAISGCCPRGRSGTTQAALVCTITLIMLAAKIIPLGQLHSQS